MLEGGAFVWWGAGHLRCGSHPPLPTPRTLFLLGFKRKKVLKLSGGSNSGDIFPSCRACPSHLPKLPCLFIWLHECMRHCGKEKMGLRLDLDFGITPYQPRDLTAAWEGCHLPSEGHGVGYMGWCVWRAQQGDRTQEALADGDVPCFLPQHLILSSFGVTAITPQSDLGKSVEVVILMAPALPPQGRVALSNGPLQISFWNTSSEGQRFSYRCQLAPSSRFGGGFLGLGQS